MVTWKMKTRNNLVEKYLLNEATLNISDDELKTIIGILGMMIANKESLKKWSSDPKEQNKIAKLWRKLIKYLPKEEAKT